MASQTPERGMVSEQVAPVLLSRVNKRTKVPDVAVLVQSVLASIIVLALFKQGEWRLWLGVLTGVSLLVAVAIFLISERTRRRAVPTGAPAPAPPVAGA